MRVRRLMIIVSTGALLTLVNLLGCGSDNESPSDTPTGILSYDEVLTWDCTSFGNSCQDVFDIEFSHGSIVSFRATETTDGSVLQIALYAPGVELGGVNLFTGDETELLCNLVNGCNNNVDGQRVDDFVIPTDGVYRLAITRSWAESCGHSGSYRLIIDSDTRFQEPDQSVDDEASPDVDTSCPGEGILDYDNIFVWDCTSIGNSCQDVFDIEFSHGSLVTFRATETTDGSVLQIALYAPGVELGGVNLFTGDETELLCNLVNGCNNNVDGQRVDDFVIPTDGVYRLAITRSWAESCGHSGSYRLIIDSDTRFQEPDQSVDDEASPDVDTSCPDPLMSADFRTVRANY